MLACRHFESTRKKFGAKMEYRAKSEMPYISQKHTEHDARIAVFVLYGSEKYQNFLLSYCKQLMQPWHTQSCGPIAITDRTLAVYVQCSRCPHAFPTYFKSKYTFKFYACKSREWVNCDDADIRFKLRMIKNFSRSRDEMSLKNPFHCKFPDVWYFHIFLIFLKLNATKTIHLFQCTNERLL